MLTIFWGCFLIVHLFFECKIFFHYLVNSCPMLLTIFKWPTTLDNNSSLINKKRNDYSMSLPQNLFPKEVASGLSARRLSYDISYISGRASDAEMNNRH